MAKSKSKNVEDVDLIERVKLPSVEKLEEVSHVGFYAEAKTDKDFLERQFRLCCESKDGESDPTAITPWCTAQTLQTMIDGCIFLHPLLVSIIRDRQKNAEDPEKDVQ